MTVPVMIISTALALAAAFYAQQQIPRFTAHPRAALLMRLGLAALGLTVGFVLADNMSRTGGPALLIFLFGLGGVHVPAAIILFLKGAAGSGKS